MTAEIYQTVEWPLQAHSLEWVGFEEYQRISTLPGQSSIDNWRN